MRRVRAKFGRLSTVPATIGIVIVLMLSAVFYFACEWGVMKLDPRFTFNPPDRVIGSFLCIRDSRGDVRVTPVNASNYHALLRDDSIRDIDKVLIDASVTIRSRGSGDTNLSDFLLDTTLRLRQNLNTRHATGLAITPDERLAVLRYLQHTQAGDLPEPLRASVSLTVSEWAPAGLRHNAMRLGVFLLAVIVAAFGIRCVVRWERRYRRWIADHCAHCGYSLEGLTISRCTECGRDRRALWRK